MCLKTMEKIDKGKDKKHASELTRNPEDKLLILHVEFNTVARSGDTRLLYYQRTAGVATLTTVRIEVEPENRPSR